MNVIKIGASYFDKASINSIYVTKTGDDKNDLTITFNKDSEFLNHSTMKGKTFFILKSLNDRAAQKISNEIEKQLKEELGL